MRAFSIIELVMVVAIIGLLSAVAIPRMEGLAQRARVRTITSDVSTVQRAIEHYMLEHQGDAPAQGGDAGKFIVRMTAKTNDKGQTGGDAIFGPYLRAFPVNVFNGLDTVRIDGADPGANTHGWHYETASDTFSPDDDVTWSGDASTLDLVGRIIDGSNGKLNHLDIR